MSMYSSTVLADSPLRYFRLGESSGTTATDSSGNGQNGTLHGGITLGTTGLLTGDSDTAETFNGTTGYIDYPTTGYPTGASAWSIERWIKMPTNLSSMNEFSCISQLGMTSGSNQGVQLYYRKSHGHFEVWGWTPFLIGSALTPQANTIYHLVLTYDGTTMRLYINATQDGSATVTMSLAYGSAQIGNDTAGDYWVSSIDEAADYGTALSAHRVTAHYLVGSTTGYAAHVLGDTPLRYYRLGEASGTTAIDLGSQGQDGTLHGGITQGTTGLLANDLDSATTFDNSTGYIDVPPTGLPSGTDLSLETWVNISSFAESGGGVSQRVFHCNLNGTNGFQFALDPAASNCFVFAVNDSTGQHITSIGGYSTSTIYHLVGTYVASSHTVTLYINGVATSNTAGQSGYGTGNSGAANIGRRTDSGGLANGVIDEVAIYGYVLTSTQIATHYAVGAHLLLKQASVRLRIGKPLDLGARLRLLAQNLSLLSLRLRLLAQVLPQVPTRLLLSALLGRNTQARTRVSALTIQSGSLRVRLITTQPALSFLFRFLLVAQVQAGTHVRFVLRPFFDQQIIFIPGNVPLDPSSPFST